MPFFSGIWTAATSRLAAVIAVIVRPQAVMCALAPLAWAAAPSCYAQTDSNAPWQVSLGAGMERMPSYTGSRHGKTMAIPYLDISWQDRYSLSTTDGLSLDIIHTPHWHSGLIGTLTWGRSYKDLNELKGKVKPLGNTLQAGAYLEYSQSEAFDLGLRIGHDLQSTGSAYATLYSDIGLPSLGGGMMHGMKLSAEFLNTSGMRRFYGLSAQEAQSLGTDAYQPRQGNSRVAAAYQAYVPLTQQLGIVVMAEFARLQGQARHSPLIAQYGSTTQRSMMATLAYHF